MLVGNGNAISTGSAPGVEIGDITGEGEVINPHLSAFITHENSGGQVSVTDTTRGSSCVDERLSDLQAKICHLKRAELLLQQGGKFITLNEFLHNVEGIRLDDQIIEVDDIGMGELSSGANSCTIDGYMLGWNDLDSNRTLQYLV